MPEFVAVEIELCDAEIAGCSGRGGAALGDEEAAVGVVEGEALLDRCVVEGLVAEEIVGWLGEVEVFGGWDGGGCGLDGD